MPTRRRLAAALAALALLVNALAPALAFAARAGAAPATIIVCTAHGAVEVPAGDLGGGAPSPVAADHDCCSVCRLVGDAPVLLPPAPAPLGRLAAPPILVARAVAAPAPDAAPPGSHEPRAPPSSA